MNGMLEEPFFFIRESWGDYFWGRIELHQIVFLSICGFPFLGEEMRAMGDALNKTISRGIAGVVHEKVG